MAVKATHHNNPAALHHTTLEVNTPAMATQAKILEVLEAVPRDDGALTLPIELDAIPGAVWQAELQSLLPDGMRVSLFEHGTQKRALLTFPAELSSEAQSAFERALQGANEVSSEAHRAAAKAVGRA
jgi:hypothetical protein